MRSPGRRARSRPRSSRPRSSAAMRLRSKTRAARSSRERSHMNPAPPPSVAPSTPASAPESHPPVAATTRAARDGRAGRADEQALARAAWSSTARRRRTRPPPFAMHVVVRHLGLAEAPDARQAGELARARVAEQLLALGVDALGRVVAAVGARAVRQPHGAGRRRPSCASRRPAPRSPRCRCAWPRARSAAR